MRELIGATLGKYSIVARLGRGGMASVYKAHQPNLDRYVAIKVLHSHLAEEVDFVGRFEREAAAVARLSHPGIVKVYDFDADDGLYYMVMELVQGPTLKAEVRVRQEKDASFSYQQIIRLTSSIASAVDYAHENGIIHRDLKPSNVMLNNEGDRLSPPGIVITDFGLAYILGTDKFTVTGSTSGTPEYMSPEQAKGERGDERSDLYSLGIMLYEMAAGRLPFVGETPFSLIMSHVNEEPTPPTELNPELPLALEGVILTALTKDPEGRFQSAGEMIQALKDAFDHAPAAETSLTILAPLPRPEAITSSRRSTSIRTARPYRGLFAFREEDASFFFGRETFAERLASAIQENRLAAVVGPSGGGKSSVVFAGLIPRLRQQANWLVIDFRPGNQPFQALADVLLLYLDPTLSQVDHLIEANKMAQALQSGVLGLAEVLRRILQRRSEAQRLLLVVDQFEELYTLCPETETRQRFPSVLLAAIGSEDEQDSPLALALTLRADFMGQALADRVLAEALQAADVKLGPMTREELCQAIERPAAQLGVSFEPGLVERILDDVGDEPGNLPLLEFALALMWDRRAGRRLTHAAYEAISRVEGALARYAEKVYARLGEQDKQHARRAFTQMVRPGEGTEDTRRVTNQQELGEEVWPLVRRLADERLVVTGRDASGQETAEVVHEALIGGWRRLAEWMDAERGFRGWQERLRASLRQWQSGEHDEAALLRGTLLSEAQEWLLARRADLSAAEQEFIQASITLRDFETTKREAQRQRELEAARKLAEAQRQRAEEQTQSAHKLRRRAWILAAVLLLAVLLAAFAWKQQREAETQRQIAVSRQLSTQSLLLLKDQLDLALLLGLEANRMNDSIETRGNLLRGLQRNSRLLMLLREHFGLVQQVALSPDGRWLASAGANGLVFLWELDLQNDVLDVRASGKTFVGHNEHELVNDVAFSPDSTILATVSDDQTLNLWEVATGELVGTIEHQDFVQCVAFSPDGHVIVTGGGNGTVRLWNLDTMQLVAEQKAHTGIIWQAAFSPDGKMIATAGKDGKVNLWNLAEGQSIELRGHPDEIFGLAFSPDGQTLASVGRGENEVWLWDVLSGDFKRTVATGHTAIMSQVQFSPDGRSLITGSWDQTIGRWDVFTGQRIGLAFAGHAGRVVGMALSSDGCLLASSDLDGNVYLWDLAGNLSLGKPLSLDRTAGSANTLAYSPDGRVVAVGYDDGSIVLYDAAADEKPGALLVQPAFGSADILALAYSPDGQSLVSTDKAGGISLWNVATGNLRDSWLDERGWTLQSVAVSPDGKTMATGGCNAKSESRGELQCNQGQIILWDLNTFEPRQTLLGHRAAVNSVAFGPDGTLLASGSCGNTEVSLVCVQGEVRLWDVATGGLYGQPLIAHTDKVNSIAFSPDGRLLASGSADTSVVLWDVVAGRPVGQRLLDHSAAVNSVAFSPDGAMLASGSCAGPQNAGCTLGQVLLWDVARGQAIGPLNDHAGLVNSVAFDPQGRWLASGGQDGLVLLWDLDVDVWRERACRKANRNLTNEEWQVFLGDKPYQQTCP